jgi:aspartate racemase
MKTIGLLGGMSWESTASYYRILNQEVKRRLGGLHSAQLVLYSVDFARIEALMNRGDWDRIAGLLSEAARKVEAAGADLLLICTNTIHHVAPSIEAAVSIPLLHIADAAGERLAADGIRCAGLLGTRFTMRENFFRERLERRYGVEVRVPKAAEQEEVHRVIFEELCRGEIRPDSRRRYVEVIEGLAADGARAVVLGCTEIALLVGREHTRVPLYDTTELHARMAVDAALEGAEP